MSPTIFCTMTLKKRPKNEAVYEMLHKLIQKYPLFAATVSNKKGCCGGTLRWDFGDTSRAAAEGYAVFVDDLECAEGERAPDESLRKYLSDKITNLPMDFTDGGFRVLTVTYAGRERCDLVWIIHHAIGDGILLLKVLVDQCEEVQEEAGSEKSDGITKVAHATANAIKKKKKKKHSIFSTIGLAIRAFFKVNLLPLTKEDKRTKLKAPRDYRWVGPRLRLQMRMDFLPRSYHNLRASSFLTF